MFETDDGVKHFKNEDRHLLSEIIHHEMNLDSRDFHFLLGLGAIYVNNQRQTKDHFISEKSLLRVHSRPRRFNCDFDWPSRIIFENDFFLILNKPAGVPTHPGVDNILENALTQTSLARKYPLFVTHRLDTLTSGLIVFGKKTSFVKNFNLQLQNRTVHKKYEALVESPHELPARLINYMNPIPGSPKKLSDHPVIGWLQCELEIEEQKQINANLRWIRINLITGRTHQIRAQLAHLKFPVQGDILYGSKQAFQKNGIALRSVEIVFSFNEKIVKFNLSENF